MNDLLQQPSELTPDKRPGLLVLSAGLATTVLTLGIVYLLGAQVMGWYVNYIIPAGAIFVGLCAGLGYGLGSWFTGAKISGRLLLMVVILQVIAYFGAQYLDYVMLRAAVGVPFSFLEYFDFVTRSFAWEDNGQPGQPFGAWGYGIRALEIAGFALSGMIAPAVLFATPYCHKCQVYMRTKDLCLLPAGVLPRKIKKKDVEGQQLYDLEQAHALQAGQELLSDLVSKVETSEAAGFAQIINEQVANKKETGKLISRIQVRLQRCSRCRGGRLEIKLIVGFGEEMETNDLDLLEVTPEFLRDVEIHQGKV